VLYVKPNGVRFSLGHHSAAEWADAMYGRYRALGVSEQSAHRWTAGYRQAVPAQPETAADKRRGGGL